MLYKNVINDDQGDDKIVKKLKISPQFTLIDSTYPSEFHADFGRGVYKIEAV